MKLKCAIDFIAKFLLTSYASIHFRAVASAYSTVFFPIVPLFFEIGIFAMWASVSMNIQFYSSRDNDGTQAGLHVSDY